MAIESNLVKTRKNILRFFLIVGIILALYFLVRVIIASFDNDDPVVNDYNPYLSEINPFEDNITLPPIQPEYAIRTEQPIFTLSSDFPEESPKFVYVYQLLPKRKTFQTVNEAKNDAKRFGFETEAEFSNDINLAWIDTNFRRLNFNSDSQTWELISPNSYLQILGESLERSNFALEDEIVSLATQNIQNISNTDIGKVDIFSSEYITAQNGVEFSESNESNTNLILLREKLNGVALKDSSRAETFVIENNINIDLNLFLNNPYNSNHIVLTHQKSVDPEEIIYLKSDSANVNVNEESIGIFEIISPLEGFEFLQRGQGQLRHLSTTDKFATFIPLDVSEFAVDVNQVELAYFIDSTTTGFTYPIYIFRGQANLVNGSTAEFVFYVDAIRK